mmetsp:Transcript_23740/g.31031  ORF Transcript_23740/g.31031 Transcript_23740/m.31031 type:complete len:361 (-) Transcript_23740:65-1147(-)
MVSGNDIQIRKANCFMAILLFLCFETQNISSFFKSFSSPIFLKSIQSPCKQSQSHLIRKLKPSENQEEFSEVVNRIGFVNRSLEFTDVQIFSPSGSISLVGSGPGDPELLTVAAIRELERADLVIADRLVSKEILAIIQCDLKIARKRPGCAEEAQEEIYQWCKQALEDNKYVVRLKIGDPLIFGRGGEEVLRFREWGYNPKLVAGVSASLSAPLLGNIPLTHRGVANQLVLGTGFGQNGTKTGTTPYHPERTAVFLMAVGRLATLCEDLKANGYPGDCPVAIIENASTPQQRLVLGKINSIAEIAQKHKVKPPSTIVFGNVVTVLHGEKEGLVECNLDGTSSYFQSDSLESQLNNLSSQ